MGVETSFLEEFGRMVDMAIMTTIITMAEATEAGMVGIVETS